MRVLLVLLLLPLYTFSQQITVKGTVFDKDTKETLPGVSIVIKGTKIGVQTDFDGNFEIKVDKEQILVFSYLGMKTIEVPAIEKMQVLLEADATQLDEITVSVGYFNINKKDLSSSVSQINSKDLEKIRTTSIEQLIQGQAAGVVVGESGEPGGGISVSIRGVNSMLGGTQPLYVVDGIPIEPQSDAQGLGNSGQQQNSISFLNPNDVEKIEILKDASATSLYGARGANGVVVITTKSGGKEAGKDALTVTVDQFISSTGKTLDLLNGPQFENYLNQRRINEFYINITNPNRTGGAFDGSQTINSTNYPELANLNLPFPVSTGVDVDWQDIIFRNALSSAYNLSYRKGDKKNNFLLSLGLQDIKGSIINTGNQRITLNSTTISNAFKDKIQIFSRTNFAHNQGNASSVGNSQIFQQRSVISNALRFQPIFGLLNPGEDDSIYATLNDGDALSNPFTLATDLIDERQSINFLQNLSISAKITPKLTFAVKGAYSYKKSSRDNYYPTTTIRGSRNNGEASQASLEDKKIYAETSLKYSNKFKNHRINTIVLGTLERRNIRASFNRAFGFGNDQTTFYNFNAATDILVPSFFFSETSLLSGLFRTGYSYKNKYYLDVNARVDASSKFAKNRQSGIFPSVAISWVASKEKFLKKIESINNFKIRASYGKTGSNPIAPYQSLATLSPVRTNFNNQIVNGFSEDNLANDDLTWENTDQYNLGLDLGLFNSKINITFDAYYKLTSNLLQNVLLPASNGFSSRVDNFGEVENKGIELSVQTKIYDRKDFSWNINTNLSINRNKLLKLNTNLDTQFAPSVGFSGSRPILFKEGFPLGVFWGAQTNGIYSDWEEAISSGIESAAPGEIKYINNDTNSINSDGEQIINFDDFVQIGDPNPDFTFAITNNLTFKNWDISFLFTGQKGGDIFWVDSWFLNTNNGSTNILQSSFDNAWKAPLDVNLTTGEVQYNPNSGHIDGASSPAPAVTTGNRVFASDKQVFDGSFIRLKNVNLGYTFLINKKHSLRVYAAGQNLITWTNYPGFDPEVTTFNKNPQRRGVDFGGYPGIQTYSFGLKFNY